MCATSTRLVSRARIGARNNAKVMRFEPPLIISDAQIDRVLAAFESAMAETQELLSDLLA